MDEQINHYLGRFQEAATLESRQQIVEEYTAFYKTLTEPEQRQADQIMMALRPSIRQRVADLDELIAKAQRQIGENVVHVV